MKVLTWNIRHGGGSPGIGGALAAHDPDVIVLTEYRDPGSRAILEQLRFFGWPHAVSSPVAGSVNGVAIIAKQPIEPRSAPVVGVEAAPRVTEVFVSSAALTIIGIYAPLSSTLGAQTGLQRRFWQNIHDLMDERVGERILLMGDFNTGAAGLDGPSALPCSDAFEAIAVLGWVDAWNRGVDENCCRAS